MTKAIAQTSEYLVASVALLLLLAFLVSACSATPPPPETTGSISRPAGHASSNSKGGSLPPIIHAPQAVPASQAVAYAPREKDSCDASGRAGREVTGSLPRSSPAPRPARKMDFVAHVIAPRETLRSISRLYRTRTVDIAAVNRISADTKLRYGDILVIPTAR